MSTTPTTDQPPGFDTGTPPPRPPWWRRKLVIIPASGLALILAASIGAAAAGGGSRTGSASQRPATPPATYTNANQIVQALQAHHVPVTNVVPDGGLSSFQGATSGVWATTAPGDSAAVFGGSENPAQDTEIVVFQNHAKAANYAIVSTDPNDPNHETILGTNWAVDAATPAAPGLRAALGGALIPNVPASTAPAAPSATSPTPDCSAQVNTWLATKTPGYQRTVGKDLAGVVKSAQKISAGASYLDQMAYGAVIHVMAPNIMTAPPMPACADPNSDWSTFAQDVTTTSGDVDSAPSSVPSDAQTIASDWQTLVSNASNAGITISVG